MKKSDKVRLIFYLLTLAAILWYPVSRICAIEFPGVEPVAYDFKLSLYDPYDPLRGRYVRLDSVMEVTLPGTAENEFAYGDRIYASLERDPEGFAEITGLHKTPPANGDYIKVEYRWSNLDHGSRVREMLTHTVELPFDRFYMNEKAAPEMEKRIAGSPDGTAIIRTLVYADGTAIITELNP